MRVAGLIGVVAVACFLAVSTRAETPGTDPHESWIPPGIRWDQAEVVVVELSDNRFDPEQIVFERNRPYKLILRNIGGLPHDLVDEQFYHSIALHSVTSATGTVRTPHVHSISIQPKAETTVYFVAVKPGSFDVFCSIPGHREDGMEGRLKVR